MEKIGYGNCVTPVLEGLGNRVSGQSNLFRKNNSRSRLVFKIFVIEVCPDNTKFNFIYLFTYFRFKTTVGKNHSW